MEYNEISRFFHKKANRSEFPHHRTNKTSLMAKNYYNILEVPQTASEQELRSAYKNQAKRWHPDKNLQASCEAHEKFKGTKLCSSSKLARCS